MNRIVSKIIGVSAFLVFLYCSAELIFIVFGFIPFNASRILSDIVMILIMLYAFYKQKKLY
ncbi:hypothetical protein EJN61_05135 [Salmonella enterica]|uniref:Uncharacterized protein n=1 Tax=Salmonella enterica subsp. enterica serovar Uganda TaxID=487004 RepID=A0A5W2Q3H8_SALET|nr:hypothetical protein [Salmonella enterica]EAB6426403.1 hypothetical protein [Salmonella enterica subsp. enterica serovar Amsterdam]EAW2485728.1 hypothetical protein [Salmonella enterica subsp. enterica]EBF2904218.1 hypothetical protein [Salmonella enterica subsp. enterica serovar Muenster]EBW4889657.1 hypothetical protein [Salmonella enterica subsp. enterica serovar Uganda]